MESISGALPLLRGREGTELVTMENIELYQRLGLAIAIGAAVGVERHWREKDEPEGARTAGIRTFTMIGSDGWCRPGLIEQNISGSSAYSGIVLTGFPRGACAGRGYFSSCARQSRNSPSALPRSWPPCSPSVSARLQCLAT